jgi:hypothetical protein
MHQEACDEHSDDDDSNTENSSGAEGSDQKDPANAGASEDDNEVSSDYDADVVMWDLDDDANDVNIEEAIPDEDKFEIVNNFAKMMIDGIANKRITQTGADFVLASLHDTLLCLLPIHVRGCVPRDWRGLKTAAGLTQQDHWYEHFCPKNHHRFDRNDPEDKHCPVCNLDTRYKPGSVMVFVCVHMLLHCIVFVLMTQCIEFVCICFFICIEFVFMNHDVENVHNFASSLYA